MEEEILKHLQKRFKGKTFNENGYTYEFLDVYIEDYHFTFVVNTLLPVKGGAYVLEKIYDDVGEIVSNFFDYIGKRFTISVNVLVDGVDVKSSYISLKDIKKIFEIANRPARNEETIHIKKPGEEVQIKVKVKYYPPKKISNLVQFDDGVGFLVYADILELSADGEEWEPNLDTEKNKGIFTSYLDDTAPFNIKFEDAMYDVLEPQIQFRDNENFYYNAYVRYKNYKHIPLETKDTYFGNTTDFLGLF